MSGRGAARFLMIFGGLFAAIGLAFLFLSIIPTLIESWQMRGWQPVEAELLAADLNTHRGDDSTTYSVSARYRYRWQGQEYEADRVGINSGSDNIGDWHEQTYQRLRSSSTVTAWIDPANPAEAILDRDIRWGLLGFEMIFVLVFGGFGLGIIWFGITLRRSESAQASPLLAKPAWGANRIRPEGRGELWVLWIFSVVWLLITSPLFFSLDEVADKGNWPLLLALLFPLVGLGLLTLALIKTVRWRRFNRALLHLSPFPGSAGGKVAGSVDLPLPAEQQTPIRVRLSCLHVYWRRSGNKSERREEVLWQDERKVQLVPGPNGSRLDFAFKPPAGLPASSSGSDHHTWRLSLEAEIAGPDLALRFAIPVTAGEVVKPELVAVVNNEEELVFIAPESAVEPAPEPAPTREILSPELLPSWLRPGFVDGALEYTLPLLRNTAIAIPFTLIGGIFGAIGLFLWTQEDAPLIFPVVFTGVGGLIFFAGLYGLGNSLRVRISPMGVELLRRVYGVPFHRRIPAAELVSIHKSVGAQAGSRVFYRVALTLQGEKSITVADSLPGAGAADYLIGEIRRYLKLEQESDEAVKAKSQARVEQWAERLQRNKRWVNLIGFIIFLFFAAQILRDFLR